MEKGEKRIKEKASSDKGLIPPSESKKAEQEFANMFNDFMYRFSNSEVFIDFLDYCLLVFRWWDPNRDFSYWENKYKDLYTKLQIMVEKLGIASENGGEGMYDALGDLFMELVSHGRNGQFFTPDNVCDMMAQLTYDKLENGQNILDPACGSSRMLLSAAKINRHVNLFGCDNDITCCKMSVVNFILNSLTGEIAHMDSLKMEYHRSWFCYTQNIMGVNYPMYDVIEDQEASPLWKIHINTFDANRERREEEKAETETETKVEEQQPILEEPILIQPRKKKKDTAQLMFDF